MKLNIFKKVANEVKEIVSPTNPSEVIDAIHNEFDTAADRALEEAMFILSQEGVNAIKKEKAKLMQALGFVNAGNVEEVRAQEYKRSSAELNANIVNKYKQKYSQYKFIFKDQVRKICKKYGLLCGKASLYKGDIPLKNLKEIESFKVQPADRYYLKQYNWQWGNNTVENLLTGSPSVISEEEHTRNRGGFEYVAVGPKDSTVSAYMECLEVQTRYLRSKVDYTVEEIPFFICAPKSDMKIEGYKTEGVFLKREIPDPIVLHYVKDGFLIVTKWGIEGDDPIVND